MKPTAIAIIIGGVLVGGAFYLAPGASAPKEAVPENNVTMEKGQQVVAITAKGGYAPRLSTAKANTPTILKIKTTGTFDCSSALSLPALNYQKNLPPSSVTEIEIPAQAAGTTFEGRCAMGMYGFKITFE